jgi:hypothetical protein
MSRNKKNPSVESKNLENDGRVATMYDELGIGEVIDEKSNKGARLDFT